jgi:glycosyltransferase involved in cell wall biosynthesis
MLPNIKILCINSDTGGCFKYRAEIPFNELKRYNVDFVAYPYLPNLHPQAGVNQLDYYLEFIKEYDLVVIQRCYLFDIAIQVRQACDILGIPFIFDTDDDYLNIPTHNPCYSEMQKPGRTEEFLKIIQMADYITVTTEELKRLYYRYNKNILVQPNNVENVHYYKDINGELERDENGNYKPYLKNGFYNIPAFLKDKTSARKLIRIGYSTNSTHRMDFKLISPAFFKVVKKLGAKAMVIYFGDPIVDDDKYPPDDWRHKRGECYIATKIACPEATVLSILPQQYCLYYLNIRNLDIGIAPLETNLFNQSKSPIKAVEYASWGIPAVLPNYITYTREFEDGKTALFYSNLSGFEKALQTLIDNPVLREEIGNNAREHVKNNRLERLHAPARYNFYRSLIESKRKLVCFKGDKKNENQESVGEPSFTKTTSCGKQAG